MKVAISLAVILFLNFVNPTSLQNDHVLKVQFNNVNFSKKGTVYVGLYDTKENFLGRKFVKSAQVEVTESSFEIVFEDLPLGTYAVSAYHDINGNQQMDFNEYGMPQEDYAMSGTPDQMGPPNWDQVKFDFTKSEQLVNVNF